MVRIAGGIALVVAAALLAVPQGSPASASGSDTSSGSRAEAPSDQRSRGVAASPRAGKSRARAAKRFWTPARMASARPVEPQGQRGARLAPASSAGDAASVAAAVASASRAATAAPRDGGVRVPRTTGKLFFRTRSGQTAVCSAAVIRARRHNQVVSAGHCVHQGQGGGWYRDWIFVPRYHNGRRPFGRWVAKRAYAPRKWVKRSRFSHDWAIIKFRKRNGRKLQQRVGGNKVKLGSRVRYRGVRVWGWPAQSPYNGRTGQMCQGKSTRWRSSRHAKIRCDLTGGASGGPWLLRKQRRTNKGIIFAVTSRRTIGGTAYLVARPLPKAFAKLKRRANR